MFLKKSCPHNNDDFSKLKNTCYYQTYYKIWINIFLFVSRATATHRGQIIFKDALAQQLCEQGGKNLLLLWVHCVKIIYGRSYVLCAK